MKGVPDPIWDKLTELFGPVRSRADRGRRNVAVTELRDAEATEDEIQIAYDYCIAAFPNCTEMALVGHFGRAQFEHEKAKKILNRDNIYDFAERMANRNLESQVPPDQEGA